MRRDHSNLQKGILNPDIHNLLLLLPLIFWLWSVINISTSDPVVDPIHRSSFFVQLTPDCRHCYCSDPNHIWIKIRTHVHTTKGVWRNPNWALWIWTEDTDTLKPLNSNFRRLFRHHHHLWMIISSCEIIDEVFSFNQEKCYSPLLHPTHTPKISRL